MTVNNDLCSYTVRSITMIYFLFYDTFNMFLLMAISALKIFIEKTTFEWLTEGD